MSNERIVLNELAPIAARMRERQELIEHGKRKMLGNVAELIALASEQGRDCLDAKTKLAGRLGWSEWLHAHVPTLPVVEAAKYERLNTEQLTEPRKCVFAFLPPNPTTPPPETTKAKATSFERWWGYCRSMKRLVTTMPPKQLDKARAELEPIAKSLWPERWEE